MVAIVLSTLIGLESLSQLLHSGKFYQFLDSSVGFDTSFKCSKCVYFAEGVSAIFADGGGSGRLQEASLGYFSCGSSLSDREQGNGLLLSAEAFADETCSRSQLSRMVGITYKSSAIHPETD